MPFNENRLRLTILGGFLGAGKSTWLRHQLFVDHYPDAHIIVNEMACHAVDDTLLQGARAVDVISGGCACCDKLNASIQILHKICNQRSRRQPAPQTRHLLFEMSGIADPGNLIEAIQSDPILARHIVLEEIIVMVDAKYGLDQLAIEPLARSQIEAADRILISKTESCPTADLAKLVATIQCLNTSQNIRTSNFGIEIELPDLPVVPAMPLQSVEDSAPLASHSIKLNTFGTSLDSWVGLSVWLSAMLHAHGNRLVRVKGVIDTPSGKLLLQSVRKIMQPPERIPAELEVGNSSSNLVVLIGRGFEQDELLTSLQDVIEGSQA